jgi:hypothetical protein
LEEARNIFSFAAPVRAKDGREGVVKKVPNDSLIAVVAFPVAPEQKGLSHGSDRVMWRMEQQEIPCSELERIRHNPPLLVGFRVV